MPASVLFFALAVGLSGALAILATHRDDRAGVYVFKPVTTLVILLAVLCVLAPADGRYRTLVAVGLACSLAGDVFLMLPRDRFVHGLASFLLAHLCYVWAFSVGAGFGAAQLVWLAPFALVAAGLTAYLWPALGKLRIPVIAYALVITAMAWRAAVRGDAARVPAVSYVAALLGACLFMVSDSLLAISRFRGPFRAAQALVLSTYWAAQFLIALSVRG